MEEILSHVMERLSNPEVLFGLAVRFFGVFIVLIIVMIVLHLTGWLFQRIDREEEVPSSSDTPARTPSVEPRARQTPAEPVPTSPGTTVPDEVAVAIALSLVPDEVAVAVAVALAEAVEEGVPLPSPSMRKAVHTAWQQQESAWKLMGRTQALFRKTALTRDITSKGE